MDFPRAKPRTGTANVGEVEGRRVARRDAYAERLASRRRCWTDEDIDAAWQGRAFDQRVYDVAIEAARPASPE